MVEIDKEKVKKIKLLYLPYITIKEIILTILYYIQYVFSLFHIYNNKKRVNRKIGKKSLNVIFIIQYIPGWNKLDTIYKRMLDDDRFNPIIFCVPLNIQNHELLEDNGNDTYKYFIEHGYKAINSLNEDGSWFDLTQLEPDYVFHSRPYNYYMPKIYTSSCIGKYALICNVLYGPNLTENGQSITLNRDYFKDVFCYFAFDLTEKEFYEARFALGIACNIQCCCSGIKTGIEQLLKSKVEKSELLYDKLVLWTPRWSTDPYIGGSNFFKYMDDFKKLATKYSNIQFIIRPHPLMFTNFIKTGEMNEDEVQAYKKWCIETKNVVLDESKEYSTTFWQSDLLITDVSAIVPEYFVTGKPIFYCQSKGIFKYLRYAQDIISTCYEINNSNDLIAYFNTFTKGNDEKYSLREKCIQEHFDEAILSSSKVVDYLGNMKDTKL